MHDRRIEDYALIGDCETAALVGIDGAIDWLCLPAFDSRACFAALLGTGDHGTFRIAPVAEDARVRRAYVDGTMVLETLFETPEGMASVIDFMPIRDVEPTVVRIVRGVRGRVRMRAELALRFDFGGLAPFTEIDGRRLVAIGGPDALRLVSPVPLRRKDGRVFAELEIESGEHAAFVLTYFPSHVRPEPHRFDPHAALEDTIRWWRTWSSRCRAEGPNRDATLRSLLTLKALTYRPTGAIVAAPTTSLPEALGGIRNWDYRHCWLRDATLTLYALLQEGHTDEAESFRDWLIRAVAGEPACVQIMYGLRGERRLPELELDWLPGFAGSRPVRIGNDAHHQHQLDIHGEIMDTLHLCRRVGIAPEPAAWDLQRGILDMVERTWREPDRGIWEVRGPERRFVHSQVMAWVAFDRGIKGVEAFGLDGPVDRWRALRARIHEEVCRVGFDSERKTFVQYVGAKWPDASLLLLPLVGFLPPEDPRVRGTVAAVEHQLMRGGLVSRYPARPEIDGLPAGEGKFLACSYWLADNYVLAGRVDEALALFERVSDLANDVGLLSEEYDIERGRLAGNFPQAFTHISLVNTSRNLARHGGPAEDRAESGGEAGGIRST